MDITIKIPLAMYNAAVANLPPRFDSVEQMCASAVAHRIKQLVGEPAAAATLRSEIETKVQQLRTLLEGRVAQITGESTTQVAAPAKMMESDI